MNASLNKDGFVETLRANPLKSPVLKPAKIFENQRLPQISLPAAAPSLIRNSSFTEQTMGDGTVGTSRIEDQGELKLNLKAAGPPPPQLGGQST
jgi:hypothetical protein